MSACTATTTLLAAVMTQFAAGLQFDAPLFADSMILQREAPAKVWGTGAAPGASVHVTVKTDTLGTITSALAVADGNGSWIATLSAVQATKSSTVVATDGQTTATLVDVAFGDVLLCGGQSNMGFGLRGAQSKNQTPAEAMATLPPIRFFFNEGSGPNGGCQAGVTPCREWFTANKTNSGGASANCILTAAYLFERLGGDIPVGAVESCVGGTNVEPWTPPSGSLYVSFIKPLLPFTFKAALWDQGEADAKRTNSTWYSTEFPNMITRWRTNFETPDLPFFYVELCTEYGAQEPKEHDFWIAQRSALALPNTGFATTTDIQRALHPPDKQDVAARLVLEIERVVYQKAVVSRGPEVVSVARPSTRSVEITFSNSSLAVHEGILVSPPTGGCNSVGHGSVLSTKNSAGIPSFLNYTINGAVMTVECVPDQLVWINADFATCFLYSTDTSLPAPPVEIPCTVA